MAPWPPPEREVTHQPLDWSYPGAAPWPPPERGVSSAHRLIIHPDGQSGLSYLRVEPFAVLFRTHLDWLHSTAVQCTISISLCGPDNCTVAAVESYFNSYRIRVATLPPFSYLGIILIYASTFLRFFMFKHKFQIFGDCSHEHCLSVLACLSWITV